MRHEGERVAGPEPPAAKALHQLPFAGLATVDIPD
jgi:hypothetical protein